MFPTWQPQIHAAMVDELLRLVRLCMINNLLPASPGEAKRLGLTERDVFEATDYYRTSW
jgi:hypothetical protein